MLLDSFRDVKGVESYHMACKLHKKNEEDRDDDAEKLTFLYKFKKGECPKSFGLNVARLAGID
jgi:DNA mismatch repair protein MSH6